MRPVLTHVEHPSKLAQSIDRRATFMPMLYVINTFGLRQVNGQINFTWTVRR
jgi:hypothetical protein